MCYIIEIALALEPRRPSVLHDVRKITLSLSFFLSQMIVKVMSSFLYNLAHDRCSKNVNLTSFLYFISAWKIVSGSHSAYWEKLVLASLGGQ